MSWFPWECCTNPGGNFAVQDGIAAFADYFSFHLKLSKWLREQVSTDDTIYQWEHLNTDFVRVTEQTLRIARTEFQSPEHWESRVEAPQKLLGRVLHAVPHTCTHSLSTPQACSSEVSTWPVSQGNLKDWCVLLRNNCCLGFYYRTTQLSSSKSVMSPGCLAQGCCLYRWIRPRQDFEMCPNYLWAPQSCVHFLQLSDVEVEAKPHFFLITHVLLELPLMNLKYTPL